MLVTTEGIVLRQIPYSDTGLITRIYTRDYGLVSFLVKGAKSPKSRGKSAVLRPVNEVFVSFYHKESKTLKTMKDCSLLFAPDAMNFGIYKSAVAMMMVEVIGNTVTEELLPDRDKYTFLLHSFDFLRQNPLINHFYLAFLYQYAHILGIGMGDELVHKYGELLAAYTIKSCLPLVERKELFSKIEAHYSEQIQGYKTIKSRGILEQILQ